MNVTNISNNKDYTNTPNEELNAASQYGIKVHEIAAAMATNNWQLPITDTLNYTDLAAMYIRKKMINNNLTPIYVESYCTFKSPEDKITINGKYDLLAKNKKGERYLIDYKTEDKPDIEGWTIQLNLYRHALEQAGQKVDQLYVLRISKKKNASWVRIEKMSKRELLEKIKKLKKDELEALIKND